MHDATRHATCGMHDAAHKAACGMEHTQPCAAAVKATRLGHVREFFVVVALLLLLLLLRLRLHVCTRANRIAGYLHLG